MSAPRQPSPFSPRTVLALVLFGAMVFVAILWMIGAGLGESSPNDGGGHVSGRGLNGYAAMAQYLERRGYHVDRVRSKPALTQKGLLVLTPPAFVDGKAIQRIVAARRYIGPTMVVTPKWLAARVPASTPGAKKGWVVLGGTLPPEWRGFADDVSVNLGPLGSGKWEGLGEAGRLPDAKAVMAGRGETLVPLVVGASDDRILAAYVADAGDYPLLRSMARGEAPIPSDDEMDSGLYPLVLVFEPDLIDNYGFGDAANARLAEALVDAALDGAERRVGFDMTLNGFGRSTNLLTLAFTPPFLAATLCLLLAALAVGWRAFNRFGPPRLGTRAIAFGKRALVANAAALIRRTGRLHLLPEPYANAARERLARALALPHDADPAATEAAIDRALAARSPGTPPFSATAAALRAARRPAEMLRAAQELHSLERILTR